MTCIGDSWKTNILIIFMKFLGSNTVHPIYRTKIKFYRSYWIGSPDDAFDSVLGFQRPFKDDVESGFTWSIHLAYVLEILRPCFLLLALELQSVRHNAVDHFIPNQTATHCWGWLNSHVEDFFSKKHEKFPFKVISCSFLQLLFYFFIGFLSGSNWR